MKRYLNLKVIAISESRKTTQEFLEKVYDLFVDNKLRSEDFSKAISYIFKYATEPHQFQTLYGLLTNNIQRNPRPNGKRPSRTPSYSKIRKFIDSSLKKVQTKLRLKLVLSLINLVATRHPYDIAKTTQFLFDQHPSPQKKLNLILSLQDIAQENVGEINPTILERVITSTVLVVDTRSCQKALLNLVNHIEFRECNVNELKQIILNRCAQPLNPENLSPSKLNEQHPPRFEEITDG